jgi:hypothetical protein
MKKAKGTWMSTQAKMDVPKGHVNVLALLRKGQLKLYEDAQAKEASRINTIRGGSAGAIIDGQVYGECVRRAHLRYEGLDTPLDEEIELMTRQGEQNEEIFIKELKASGTRVLTQDDVGLQLDLFGTKFIGSPDIALVLDDSDRPSLGIENKNISGISKAMGTHYELKPDAKHMIQAATYSYRLGQLLGIPHLPYQLIYSSRVVWQAFSLSKKASEAVQNNPIDVEYKYGKLHSIKPFHRVYYLDWTEDDRLKYTTHGYKDWVVTNVTKSSLDYHADVVANKLKASGNLGPRPTTLHIDGSRGYSPCNYCPFQPVCDEHEDGSYEEWLDHAQLLSVAAHKKRAKI